MILINMSIKPVYVFRPDWYYNDSSHKYVLLRNIQYNLLMKCVGEHSLDETAANLLANLYARVPDSSTMQSFTAPSLDNMPTTLYSRGDKREGSDYITLPSEIYDWEVSEANHVDEDPETSTTETYYMVTGRWKYYQGMFHGITRRI